MFVPLHQRRQALQPAAGRQQCSRRASVLSAVLAALVVGLVTALSKDGQPVNWALVGGIGAVVAAAAGIALARVIGRQGRTPPGA